MTEKIDLRRGPRSKAPYITDGKYPEEIVKLIEKHNGVIGTAEKAARVSLGYFGKVRRGTEPWTEFMKGKVLTALKGEVPPKAAEISKTIPEKCPPILAELIDHQGSKARAIRVLGTTDGTFYAVIRGDKEMPKVWSTRAKAAMGQRIIGASILEDTVTDKAAAPPMPEFVMWDRKTFGTITIRSVKDKKPRVLKKVPQPLVELVEKYGSVADASRSLGFSPGSLTNWLKPDFDFNLKRQKMVHAGMHGAPASLSNELGEDFDKYTLGLAICLLKSSNYDRIAEIAEILNGRLCFRKNTSGGWIVIYRMKVEDLPKFKRLGIRDANEIVCP